MLPFVKIWVSKLKKRKAFTLYMISNDKNTSYSTDLCLLKKKLNVHGKYKFNYVHYVIDETNWDEILTKSNHKTNKNNISPLRLKEILERLIAGYDMKTVS
ncbi:hypothetical protein HYE26_03790 [Mycoplasmopsis bovis]|nr:hypothetical protein [Mycoplasmopsis bovis]QQH23321.1 hypothetical protein HYE26_03790 [Mycoplasmopsis bovis]